MPDQPVADIIAAGRLGRFWEWRDGDVDMTTPPMYGHLIRVGSRVEATVAVSDDADDVEHRFEDALSGQPVAAPEAVLAVLEHETFLLLGLSRRGPGLRWKQQPLTNTATYTARHIVAHTYGLERVNSPQLRSASVVFPGMLAWAGVDSVQRTSEVNDAGRITTGRIDLLPLTDAPSGRIRPGLSLDVDVRWSVNEAAAEQLTVSTGLDVKLTSRLPAPVEDFVRSLGHVQLAITLAHRSWKTPLPGQATLDVRGNVATLERSQFWSGELMTAPASAAPDSSRKALPYVTYEQLGQARGLARWVQLCDEIPRVVEPLKMFHRNGATTVYDHINATCSAIEYWAASWKTRPGWQSAPGDPSGGLGKMHVVARRAGREWTRFVGDLDKWAAYVWDAYLSTKHFRPSGQKLSMGDLRLLTTSVDLLLTAALMNEAAGTKTPTRAMVNHYELAPLGERLRQLVA